MNYFFIVQSMKISFGNMNNKNIIRPGDISLRKSWDSALAEPSQPRPAPEKQGFQREMAIRDPNSSRLRNKIINSRK